MGSDTLSLFTDGACRGNPGLGGAGAVLMTGNGQVIATAKKFLGRCTNNIAEYRAKHVVVTSQNGKLNPGPTTGFLQPGDQISSIRNGCIDPPGMTDKAQPAMIGSPPVRLRHIQGILIIPFIKHLRLSWKRPIVINSLPASVQRCT